MKKLSGLVSLKQSDLLRPGIELSVENPFVFDFMATLCSEE